MATISTEAPVRPDQHQAPEGTIQSLIPARLDRLGWSRFHTRLVIALGVAWMLDGLEITIASNAEGLISQKQALNLSSSEVAFAVGAVTCWARWSGLSSSGGCQTSSAGATCS